MLTRVLVALCLAVLALPALAQRGAGLGSPPGNSGFVRGGVAPGTGFPGRGFPRRGFPRGHGRIGFGTPVWLGDGWIGYDDGYAPDAPSDVDSQLSREVESLRDEVTKLRHTNEQAAEPATPPLIMEVKGEPTPAPQRIDTRHAATVLVLRDGQKVEVDDYAVSGQSVWILSSLGAKEIPLSRLDLPATAQANANRGTQFIGPSR